MTVNNEVCTDLAEPLVSTVIPTHNRPEIVCRAVRSALAQTHTSIEVVVVVDGPDPATVTALKRLDEARVRIVALEESVGGSEARNVGVREARGQYVALLDDDDEWLPEKTAVQLAIAEDTTAARTVVMCRFYLREANGKDTVRPRRLMRLDESAAEYIFDPMGGFKTSTFFCSRDLLLSVPFTRGLKGCQDPDWLLKVVEAGNYRFIIADQVLAVYYAPTSNANVTRRLDVGFKLDWIQAHKQIMSKRAYSLFIVSMCAPTAFQKRFAVGELFRLLWECVFVGDASPGMLLHFFSIFFLPISIRHQIRDWVDVSAWPGVREGCGNCEFSVDSPEASSDRRQENMPI